MKKIDRRGRYMDSWTPEKKKEIMAEIARKRWANMSMEEKKEYGRKLAESRKRSK